MALNNAVNAQTSGYQVLNTSTGAWSGRTFQAGTGISLTNADGTAGNTTISATGVAPGTSTVVVYDDFMSFNTASYVGDIQWSAAGAAGAWLVDTADLTNGHPGVISLGTTLAAGNAKVLQTNDNNDGSGFTQGRPIILGGGTVTINWVFKIVNLSTASPRYILRMGMMNGTTSADQVDGVYFEYSDNINSGAWVLKTASASTRTTTNSATTVTAAWHNAQITVNAAASSVNFTMDGVSLGNITTNIPTAALAMLFNIAGTVGTTAAGSVAIDMVSLNMALTTPR